jgi:hypothetical protein
MNNRRLAQSINAYLIPKALLQFCAIKRLVASNKRVADLQYFFNPLPILHVFGEQNCATLIQCTGNNQAVIKRQPVFLQQVLVSRETRLSGIAQFSA